MKPPSPSLSRLETLPLDIFEGICAYLVAQQAPLGNPSLAALASTSRRLCDATAPLQFRSIQLRFTRESELAAEVERWRQLLDARGCASHVRRLGVVEADEPPDKWEGNCGDPWPPDRLEDPFERVKHEIWPVDKDDEFWSQPEPIRFYPWEAVRTPAAKAEQQRLWAPVIDLVAGLRGLGDVDYQCMSQVPRTLLRALNERDGGPVRLHVHSFSLRSLYQNASALHDVDEDELYLATSPCLSSIRLLVPAHSGRPQGCDHNRRLCFNEEAVGQMVAGLAPNLKFVSVDSTFSEKLVPSGEEVRWPGFVAAGSPIAPSEVRGRGALETLALGIGQDSDPEAIREWAGRTDFAALRSLHLRTSTVEIPGLNTLSEMADTGGLRSLRSLSLWTSGSQRDEDVCDIGDAELARLLRALPPLRSLELKGPLSHDAFDAILASHGPSLRRLRLVPLRDHDVQPRPFVLSRKRVEALVRSCPNLEGLELLVPRSKGDEEEACIYRALSGLSQLDRLSLLLDCSNILAVDQESDDSSAELFEPHVRDGIINLNTSSRELATDIFDAVCLGKSPRIIRLYPEEIGNFGTEVREWSILFIKNELSRGWIRERDDREGHRGESRITEVKSQGFGRSRREPFKSEFYSALDSIWPEAGGWPEGIPEMRSFRLWKPRGE